MKPNVVVPPAAKVPFQLAFVAVTAEPLAVTVALQDWVMRWPVASCQPTASATVQISLADAVVLRDGLTGLIEAVGHAPGGPS